MSTDANKQQLEQSLRIVNNIIELLQSGLFRGERGLDIQEGLSYMKAVKSSLESAVLNEAI